jgi:hypothetical protein
MRHPLDVLVGTLIGLFTGGAVLAVYRWKWGVRKPDERIEES